MCRQTIAVEHLKQTDLIICKETNKQLNKCHKITLNYRENVYLYDEHEYFSSFAHIQMDSENNSFSHCKTKKCIQYFSIF